MVFYWLRVILTFVITWGVLVVAVAALVDGARRQTPAYPWAEKRTKKFWLLLLGAGALFGLMGLAGMLGIMLTMLAVVPAAIYWYDVRPAVRLYSGGRASPGGKPKIGPGGKPKVGPRSAATQRFWAGFRGF